MNYTDIASQAANLSFLFWLLFFGGLYVLVLFRWRSLPFIGLSISGAVVLLVFTLLNIFVAPLAMFGGGSDNLLAFASAEIGVYIVHFLLIGACFYVWFSKARYRVLASLLLLYILLFLGLFYYLLIAPALILFAIITAVIGFTAFKLQKNYPLPKLVKALQKPALGTKVGAVFLFALSLVWVGGFVYRNREVVFDCAIHLRKSEFLPLWSTVNPTKSSARPELIQRAQPFEVFKSKIGNPDTQVVNYLMTRYSPHDVTYFYCPHPLLGLADECRGYRVTVANDGDVRSLDKRGLYCGSTMQTMWLNPINDKVYYFYWSSHMWSFDFVPSEHYVMKNGFLAQVIENVLNMLP